MPKVISPITLHEKINQPKTTCSLMSAKKDPIVNVCQGGSLLVLAEPFCPYMGYSRKENQYKHVWEATKTSGGNQQKQQWKRIDKSEKKSTQTATTTLFSKLIWVNVRQMTIFNIATLHYNISFSSNTINISLRFRLPAMTFLEYIFTNVKDLVIRQSFILFSFPRSCPWGAINILLYDEKYRYWGSHNFVYVHLYLHPTCILT